MQTKRDYLAGLNPPLAKPGTRGRFSKAALAESERARQSGMKFSDDDGPVKHTDTSETKVEDAPYVPTPIRSKPILRDIKKVVGFTIEGHIVEQGQCVRCSEHVARCNCPGGIVPSPIIVRWSEESAPYGEAIATPVKA